MSTGFAVPLYRQYIIRNDLEIARQNITQALQRARFLSQVGMNDSGWGFAAGVMPGEGTLFMGASYATRDPGYDESYAIPATIAVSGMTEVAFSKIRGNPDRAGTMTLTALSGEQRYISVTVGDEGTVSIPEDWMEICVDPYGENPRTIQVPDSLWEYYQEHGAVPGSCESLGDDDDDDNDAASSSASSEGSGVDEEDIDVVDDTVTPQVSYTCTIKVLGSAITYGASGYNIPVTLQARFGNSGWLDLFGNWQLPVDANLNDGQPHEVSCSNVYSAGTSIDFQARSWVKKHFWYSGDSNSHWQTFYERQTMAQSERFVWALQNGDAVPDVSGFANQASVADFVADYVDTDTGTVTLPGNQVIYLFELATVDLDSSAADFQDLVVLLSVLES